MARYIDVEGYRKLFDEEYKKTRKLISEGETHLDNLAEGFSEASRVIDGIPTANVVPTERLENALKLLEKTEDELYGPEGEVTKLTAELNAMRGAANSYKMHYENAKAEVAREIFAEIEGMFIRYTFDDDYIALGIKDEFDELKKKYTEGAAADGDKQE